MVTDPCGENERFAARQTRHMDLFESNPANATPVALQKRRSDVAKKRAAPVLTGAARHSQARHMQTHESRVGSKRGHIKTTV